MRQSLVRPSGGKAARSYNFVTMTPKQLPACLRFAPAGPGPTRLVGIAFLSVASDFCVLWRISGASRELAVPFNVSLRALKSAPRLLPFLI